MGRWRVAVLVSAAIAISYLDRQTLPVAVHAITRDIPLSNEQFSYLQSAFLLAYALMDLVSGHRPDPAGGELARPDVPAPVDGDAHQLPVTRQDR